MRATQSHLLFIRGVFLFDNLKSIAHDLMLFFDTRTHYPNITSQFHHQGQFSFRCADTTKDQVPRDGREPGTFVDV